MHSPCFCDLLHAILQVAAWRMRGRVPLGVDSTACLAEAQLRDRAAAAKATTGMTTVGAAQPAAATATASDSELRLQYALAVVRMVNGIADSAQRGRVAASVAGLAAAAGTSFSLATVVNVRLAASAR
jgi:ribosomal biogenesis protein LAS1